LDFHQLMSYQYNFIISLLQHSKNFENTRFFLQKYNMMRELIKTEYQDNILVGKNLYYLNSHN